MRTLLIIPAYNEQDCIEQVVGNVRDNYPQYDYVVVNDGSTDFTADICRRNGYRFIDLPVNLGLAGAFQAGIKYAKKRGYDCAIQFDADGQHLPEHLAALVEKLDEPDTDIVIGSRFLTEPKPHSLRMAGSRLISGMLRLVCGQKITDPTSGMRAWGKRAINLLAVGPNLGPEPDTLAYLMKKHGLHVSEIQVSMSERVAGTSYLNLSHSIKYMARTSVAILFIRLFR